ncbi:hypothetical protein [Flammeovirga sp. SJP92]|uniref:hypothetical protein n=1 Tax=Flammeovirga sp. SJP92 TaxID=1775430 RepID=UPI000786CA98|nr:hypothetical protein [Flammeovirga sp. SJP92]KXX70885.1 hypothetical protein AVL50_10965 [Flammeovirga sp. SJP92]
MKNGKAKIENTIDNYSVTIPSKKNWFALLFGVFWLVVPWYAGFRSTITNFSFEHNAFLMLWLIGWTIGGGIVVLLLLWGCFGEEKLEFDQQEVTFGKTIFGIGLKKKLIRKEVTNFRFEKIDKGMFNSNQWTFWGLGPGKIKFDHGLKTYSFGIAVDDAEANYLSEELRMKTEQYTI